MDRRQACDEYTDQYPSEDFHPDVHIIVSDYNFEDHWIIGAIAHIAVDLCRDNDAEDKRRRLYFLVDLLRLPMPEGWDEEAIDGAAMD